MKVLAEGVKVKTDSKQEPSRLLWIFFAAYFTFGIVLNVVGVIIPVLIKQYSLSLFAGGLLAFAFYISFGVFSIPAGWAADRIGSKPVVLTGVFLMGAGCAAIPWATGYGAIAFLAFTIGAGIALLQTAGNPLIAYLDRRENYHRNLTLTIGFCGIGAFAGPLCLSALQAHGLPWQRLYLGYSVLCAILLVLLWVARFPSSSKPANEKLRPKEMLKLLSHPLAVTYFLAIFFYVGAEVGTASWIVKFFQQMHGLGAQRGTYAGENFLLRNLPALPALTVSLFWGLQGLGRLTSAPGIRKLGPPLDAEALRVLRTWLAAGCHLCCSGPGSHRICVLRLLYICAFHPDLQWRRSFLPSSPGDDIGIVDYGVHWRCDYSPAGRFHGGSPWPADRNGNSRALLWLCACGCDAGESCL